MTTILILGAGVMQEPAIRIAKRKGWRVLLADGNPRAVARGLADEFVCIDLKDRDGLLSFARLTRESAGLDGVFTAGTDFSSSVAWVAAKLGLPGIPYAAAMRATDKCLMREAFSAAEVPSPRFTCWPGTGDPRLPPGMKYPLVVKPVDNMGARGVRRVENAGQLGEACREALALSRTSRVIVEEYMEGPEFSLDAIVYRGNISICGVADRLICFPPSFVEMGHTIPTGFPADTVRDIESVFAAGIQAIGIDNGAAKGDIKLTPEGPMVGEIAARLSGGYMSGWTYPLSSGVEVTEAALDIAVGAAPGDLVPRVKRVCAERALISIPGIVEEVTGEQVAQQVAGVSEVFLRVGAGDTVVFPSNNVQKCGNVLAVADKREEAEAAAYRALGSIQVRLRPLIETTTTYVFRNAVHECFEALPPGLCESIRSMPGFRGDPSLAQPDSLIPIEAPAGWDSCAAVDWHGQKFNDSARCACVRGRGAMAPADGGFVVCGLFWKALVKGGIQGGVYILDSIREAARRGTLVEFLKGP